MSRRVDTSDYMGILSVCTACIKKVMSLATNLAHRKTFTGLDEAVRIHSSPLRCGFTWQTLTQVYMYAIQSNPSEEEIRCVFDDN